VKLVFTGVPPAPVRIFAPTRVTVKIFPGVVIVRPAFAPDVMKSTVPPVTMQLEPMGVQPNTAFVAAVAVPSIVTFE
jgi:hypothetical protein